MKTLKTAVLLSAFTFGAVAVAGDTTTETKETKIEKTAGKNKAATKVESTTKTDPPGMMNSTTDSVKVENEQKALKDGRTEASHEATAEHDAPGVKNDKKSTTKAKVVKDANGNVIERSKEETVK